MTTDIGEELAVQSYCFRAFEDNARVAELVRECGLSRIELCGRHVDMADEKSFQGVVDTYRSAGVEIPSIGVAGFGTDEAAATRCFEFARCAGAGLVGADFNPAAAPDNFRMAEKLSEKYDIPLAIHNHGARHWLGSVQILRTVFERTSPRIGLCLDTAWALDSRQDPVAMTRQFADRLLGLHLKDFVFDRAGKPEDVIVGSGTLDMPDLFAALKEVEFSGCATLEYEGDVDDPVPALKKCVEAIRREWQGA
jgi:sugar phosphate isomerase/epimerase